MIIVFPLSVVGPHKKRGLARPAPFLFLAPNMSQSEILILKRVQDDINWQGKKDKRWFSVLPTLRPLPVFEQQKFSRRPLSF